MIMNTVIGCQSHCKREDRVIRKRFELPKGIAQAKNMGGKEVEKSDKDVSGEFFMVQEKIAHFDTQSILATSRLMTI